MLGEVSCIVGENLVLYSANWLQLSIIYIRFHHFRHTTDIIILSQEVLTLLVEGCQQVKIMVVHDAKQLLFALRHEKFLKVHRVKFHGLNLAYRKGNTRMQCYSEQGACHCNMVIRSVFTEIFQ